MRLFRLSDLNDDLRSQAEAQLAPRKAHPKPAAKDCPSKSGGTHTNPAPRRSEPVLWSPKSIEPPPTRIARESKMSATERRYQRDVLQGKGRFEPITLVLPGGGRYTADFLTIEDGVPTLTEVKGSYRLGSQGRAFTAFHEAAAAFPFFRFVWAEEKKGGGFKRTTIPHLPTGLPEQEVS